jgi:hypothetical protein
MQPIAAKDVDRVKYGDCKGLTNYTKALLDLVGVKSYYTRLYAASYNRLDVDKDFVSFQGQTNHVILNIPQENKEDIWLECTNQKIPFGFLGNFSDDRDVLVITSEGGKIKHTKKYTAEENSQVLKGNYAISSEGHLTASVNVCSKGIQYNHKYYIDSYEPRDKDVAYKKRWKYINNLSIANIDIENDKDNVQFKENLSFSAQNYSKKAGERMLFVINALNRNKHVPKKYRNRTMPLKVKRGFVEKDEITITLPQDYNVESLPKNKSVENKFGSYNTEITVQNKKTLVYKREFIIRDGEYPKEDYDAFRNFYKTVARNDNGKIALIKIQP